MDYIPSRESYAERRQLFKTIWETAMNIDEKEDIMARPKVIKTLRLDEVDKCVVGKNKKQRIKNLRHVCKRILDFCDRQDADDVFYEQMATDGQEHGPYQTQVEEKPLKKIKTRKGKKKVKKAKSSFGHVNDHGEVKASASEPKDDQLRKAAVKLKNTSPFRTKKTSFVRNTVKDVKSKTSPRKSESVGIPTYENTKHSHNVTSTRRKVVRKRNSKKKKASDTKSPPQNGTIDWSDP